MIKLFEQRPWLLFAITIIFVFLAAFGPDIIQYPPCSVHYFRQGDCLAYTKTYYQRNSGFFSPSGYNLIGRGGKVVSEFPILYYLSAKLCKILGFHFWIIRGVTFLTYILGLYYLLLCIRLWIDDWFLPLFIVIILGTCPYYFYYAVNFLPNVPAISFSFAGLYYTLLFRRSARVKHIIAGTLFFILSCLLKPTDGGLIWIAVMMIITVDYLKSRVPKAGIVSFIASFLAVAISIVGWFLFVRAYNKTNGNEINLQGFFGIWDMEKNDIIGTFTSIVKEDYRKIYQHDLLLLFWILCTVIYFVKWKQLDPFLRMFTLWLIIGAWIYAPLWFHAFYIHDYYQLIFAIPAVFICITVTQYFSRQVLPTVNKRLKVSIYAAMGGLMVVSIYHNQRIQIDRFGDTNLVNPAIYEVEPYLRSIGITASDSVMSVPDFTPNVSLAAFGNPGYTSDLFGPALFNVPYCRKAGIKYMIIYDANYLHKPEYEPYTSKPMGEFKGIYIFDIR